MARQEPNEIHFVHRRAGHVMVAYDNRLFVWGGYMELPHAQPYNLMTQSKCLYHSAIDIWMFDPLLDTWTRKMSRGDIPNQLSGACAAVHQHHMYLFGGWTNNDVDEFENTSNSLYRIHLPTLTWELLFPVGVQPFNCDKAACWVYKNRFYIFGGFGPPRPFGQAKVNFVRDNLFPRGWLDQLVYYDIDKNEWVWPDTSGPKPCPRAAHTADVTGDRVYIFGGRHKDVRMNDVNCLDLVNSHWSGNLTDTRIETVPEGRSWHTFNFVSKNKGVLYGGFNSTQQVLNDCWMMEITAPVAGFGLPATEGIGHNGGSIEWQEVPLAYDHGEPRCWHASAVIPPGEVYILSGLTQPFYITILKLIDHAEELLIMRFSPPSLQRLTLEVVCQLESKFRPLWCSLPKTLQHILEVRTTPDRIR